MDPDTKERLIEQFRACLDSGEDELADEGEPVDLRTLLAEMAALKNEVRLQARQFKTALEQMHSLSEVLREHNQALVRDLERSRSQAADAKAQAERGLLLGLLELRDHLQAAMNAQMAWRPAPLLRLLGGAQRYARSLREGSALTLQRLDELLASHRVRPIAAVGHALDPQCMHAAAIEWAPQATEGVVLRELRRGFYQGTELLRAAEVIVNKKGHAP
ncbi:MAG TPA: nucleotide exchange factor GrpE [Caldimonas sp.]